MEGSSRNKLHIDEILPQPILSNIFSLITDTRTRNAMSLVCLRWRNIERSTRTSLTLRGNIRNIYLLPTCFHSIKNLDLSLLSPWGYPLLDSSPNSLFIAKLLSKAFPKITHLTIYAQNPYTILQYLAPEWPNVTRVKLVRWHSQFVNSSLGYEFIPLFENFNKLSSLDLSYFYCLTEDVPPILRSYPNIAASLSHLNILIHSSSSGFKSHELQAITAACPNLREFLAVCVFDLRLIGCVMDETLLSIASNCPNLSLLHLFDSTCLTNNGCSSNASEAANINLGEFFTCLPMLEDLVLDLGNCFRYIWPSLESLNFKCPRLKCLKLGGFNGICKGVDYSRPYIFKGLESFSIKNSIDFSDDCLTTISLNCPKLFSFEVQGCHEITQIGLSKLACVLHKTLIDVRISSCKNLSTLNSLHALNPIHDQIQHLHLDFIWETSSSSEDTNLKKKAKTTGGNENLPSLTWRRLKCLSVWVAIGELLNPLFLSGIITNCPMLEEIRIKVDGDSRFQARPSMAFGLSSLVCYPKLCKMNLDLSNIIGFALTAPVGHTDLSLWERFYLNGIERLKLHELDYWAPQDMDVNNRSVSLPGAGLIAQCSSLRRLVIHGTVNEHFMMFFLQIQNLRNVQLREDYYPTTEDETAKEMRMDSYSRFEDALNRRSIPD